MSSKSYAVAGPNFEKHVICPYDKAHRIMPNRLAVHLIRCSRNFPSTEMVHCPFNVTHLYSVADMMTHVSECQSRSDFERYKLPNALPPAKPKENEFMLETEEDWDLEPPAPTYNPQKYCEESLVIRNPQGQPPASRRRFRENEQRRFKELQQKK
ncbi:gametocyte-specific factor 1 homolog [Drosophila ficusphila]|uniref:gametocyte-specific factor 1 homolog n=1 Tax=Drosophila ficusphila TaxID=30025 RepID=UPI0007E6BF45|nr:gametocyte-specific factor 1 homolog [Drosophila ficusphila]